MEETLNRRFQTDHPSNMDTDLIARAIIDSEDFDEIYQIYYPRLFRYIMRTVMNVTLAEDIVAETFLKIIQALPTFRGDLRQFSSWAYRIATNCMMDEFRRRRREYPVEDMEIDYPRLAGRRLIAETTPSSELEQMERYAQVHQAIRKLKPVYQVAIILYYFEDKSYGEIAQIVRRPAATVRWRLHHARKRLLTSQGEVFDQ